MNLFGINGWEVVVIALIALLVIGPDKLPGFVSDARRMIRQVKRMADDARTEVTSQLGPEFQDIDIKDLNPRAFVKKHLFDDEDLDLDTFNPFKDDDESARPGATPVERPRSDGAAATSSPAATAKTANGATSLVKGESPAATESGSRWDADAT